MNFVINHVPLLTIRLINIYKRIICSEIKIWPIFAVKQTTWKLKIKLKAKRADFRIIYSLILFVIPIAHVSSKVPKALSRT